MEQINTFKVKEEQLNALKGQNVSSSTYKVIGQNVGSSTQASHYMHLTESPLQ
jgi:hypothetical protein